MRLRSKQVAALGVAGAMLAAGFGSVLLSAGTPTGVRAAGDYTIEILPSGFNPENCQVNRNGSTVRFLNKDDEPRRIVVDAVGGQPEQFQLDTGWIEPGATNSAGWSFQSADRKEYHDYDNPSLRGVIEAPLDPGAPSVCSPLPPTPTPTNTPTITPTPTRTATPTPTPPPLPTPEACVRLLANPLGCQVAIWVSTDGPLE